MERGKIKFTLVAQRVREASDSGRMRSARKAISLLGRIGNYNQLEGGSKNVYDMFSYPTHQTSPIIPVHGTLSWITSPPNIALPSK